MNCSRINCLIVLLIHVPDNWSVKAIRRKTTGTGRMRHLRHLPRRFSNNFREGASYSSVLCSVKIIHAKEITSVFNMTIISSVLRGRLQDSGGGGVESFEVLRTACQLVFWVRCFAHHQCKFKTFCGRSMYYCFLYHFVGVGENHQELL